MTPLPNPRHARRWLILGVIAIAQLMVVLDAARREHRAAVRAACVGFSDDARQWIVAFWVAAGIFAAGALVVGATMRAVRFQPEALGEPVST